MKAMAIVLISVGMFGCATTNKRVGMNVPAVVAIASAARAVEAYRDAENFNDAIGSRSDAWHALKPVQYGLWGVYGYLVIDSFKRGSTVEKVGVIALSLAAAWVSFEGGLLLWRE